MVEAPVFFPERKFFGKIFPLIKKIRIKKT